MISIKSYCYYLLSILLYLCLDVLNKGKQETSVGEVHYDNETRSDHENH
jgi:hypothetical protein